MKEYLLVSSCLGGFKTKYNGNHNKVDFLRELSMKYHLVFFCPEVVGGLSIPRNPSEIRGSAVFSSTGTDVTKEYRRGAEAALKIAQKYHISKAVLKEASPSCGATMVYDGTFTGGKIKGKGITVQLLEENGIQVFTEQTAQALL